MTRARRSWTYIDLRASAKPAFMRSRVRAREYAEAFCPAGGGGGSRKVPLLDACSSAAPILAVDAINNRESGWATLCWLWWVKSCLFGSCPLGNLTATRNGRMHSRILVKFCPLRGWRQMDTFDLAIPRYHNLVAGIVACSFTC